MRLRERLLLQQLVLPRRLNVGRALPLSRCYGGNRAARNVLLARKERSEGELLGLGQTLVQELDRFTVLLQSFHGLGELLLELAHDAHLGLDFVLGDPEMVLGFFLFFFNRLGLFLSLLDFFFKLFDLLLFVFLLIL